MTGWQYTPQGKYFEVDEWWLRLPWDDNNHLNGFHSDDIYESVERLIWLLVKLRVISGISTEGEQTIWMDNKR